MRIVFLPSAAQDLAWFRYYYLSVFPEGSQNAGKHFKAIKQLLAANPYIGSPSEGHDSIRELPIARTPFTLIYRVSETQIEILRLWDNRQGSHF